MYARLAIRKVATSSCHPKGNGGVERVNHTMAQMLAMVVNERQDDWDVHLPHVEFAYNNSVSAATGLGPNEVHMNRLPRLPMTVLEHPDARGHQSLHRDQLEYCDLAADRQRRSYDLVRNSTFCPFRGSSGGTPLSRMLYSNFLLTLLVEGFASTTPNLPFAKVFVQVQMTRFSKPNYLYFGPARSKIWWWARVLKPLMAILCRLTYSTWTSRRISRARTRNAVCLSCVVSLVLTHTTPTACHVFFPRVSPRMC